MKKYVTFTWLSCNCGGTETCLEEEFEEKKKFFKAVFGAYPLKLFIINPETPETGSCEAGYFAPDDGKPHRTYKPERIIP